MVKTQKSFISVLLLSGYLLAYAQTPQGSFKEGSLMKNAKKPFSGVNPEDITNENFPDKLKSFEFKDADLSDVVSSVAKLVGQNFILEDNLKGKKITIITHQDITIAEAYRAFLSALAINNYTIVPMPNTNFLKVRQIPSAMQDSIETYSGGYFPNTDQVITRIIKLRYISATEVTKSLSKLKSRNGSIEDYEPTNSLIITDLGTNIERIERILQSLDVPGFEEKLSVIRIKHAKAKEIAEMVNQIINKGESSSARRFRRSNQPAKGGTGSESYSLVVSDERSNSVIVVGNTAGIEKINKLIEQLDFPINPDDAGGVYVYRVRYGEAEKIANVINGVAKEIKDKKKTSPGGGPPLDEDGFLAPSLRVGNEGGENNNLFGGDVKITADKDTNSLIVTASKQDYKVVKSLLSKIDIPRDQVFVKAIIMGINAESNFSWDISAYKLIDSVGGLIPRIGFSTGNIGSMAKIGDKGEGIFSFSSGKEVNFMVPGTTTQTKVNEVLGFVNFLKVNAGGSVLSTPQVTATDNEPAEIESNTRQPLGQNSVTTQTATSVSTERQDIKIGIKFTPYISPDTDSVRLKIKQTSGDIKKSEAGYAPETRLIETNVLVNDGETIVLGGLIRENEEMGETKVPILGDIPLIGWLFKGVNKRYTKENMLVFLTPKIIRNTKDSNQVLERALDERLAFLQKNNLGKDPFGLVIDQLPRKSLKRAQDSSSETEKSMNETTEELETPATESF